MSQDLTIPKKYAEIQEVKGLPEPNENVLRVFCNMYPDNYTLQIRTHKGITGPYGEGKARDMIATVHVDIEEVEEILRQMKAYKAGEPSVFDHRNTESA